MKELLPVQQLDLIVQNLASRAVSYALLSIVISVVAMSLIEVVKALTRARLVFHLWMIMTWIGGAMYPRLSTVLRVLFSKQAYAAYRARQTDEMEQKFGSTKDRSTADVEGNNQDIAREELLLLATGGGSFEDEVGFMDQPSSRMMAQVQTAATTALDFPWQYRALYKFLTREDKRESTTRKLNLRLQGKAKESQQDKSDQEYWSEYAGQFSAKVGSMKPGGTKLQIAAQARGRLGNAVERKLDAFQNKLERTWVRLNQFMAITVGAFILMYILLTNNVESPATIIFVSLMGALPAPLAKDLYVALRSLRPTKT